MLSIAGTLAGHAPAPGTARGEPALPPRGDHPAAAVPFGGQAGNPLLEWLATDGQAVDWRDLALCAETDPDAFFPEIGEPTRPAKAVCARCVVRAECLEFALEHDERFGVWGGLSERQRRKLKQRAVQ